MLAAQPMSQEPGGAARAGVPEGGALKETVVALNRVAKVVKGGKRFSFSALVVVGDHNGSVGVGLGKAKEVQAAIQKGSRLALRNAFQVPLIEGTIPHEVIGHFGAGRVWMKPAGTRDVLTKSLGSANPFSMVYAAVEALKQLKTKEEVHKIRGKA